MRSDHTRSFIAALATVLACLLMPLTAAAQAVPGPLFTFSAYLGAVMAAPPNGVMGAALALVAIVNARRHADLNRDYESAFRGVQFVERLNGMIYAMRLEARGVFMSADNVSARRYASNLVQYNDRLGDVLTEWTWVLRPSERAQFEALSGRIKAYQAFTRDMVLHADDYALKLTFGSGDADSEDTMRQALNQDLETFAQLYSHRAQFAFAEIERGVAGRVAVQVTPVHVHEVEGIVIRVVPEVLALSK